MAQGAMYLTGILQRGNTENGNGRIYTKEILIREDRNYQTLIRQNRALGELDHSDGDVINLKELLELSTLDVNKRNKVICIFY